MGSTVGSCAPLGSCTDGDVPISGTPGRGTNKFEEGRINVERKVEGLKVGLLVVDVVPG